MVSSTDILSNFCLETLLLNPQYLGGVWLLDFQLCYWLQSYL